MSLVYECTVLISLGLIAIIATVFVFVASIQAAVLRRAAEETKGREEQRREKIQNAIDQIQSTAIEGNKQAELIKELNQDIEYVDTQLGDVKAKVNALSLSQMVKSPLILLSVSIIFSLAAIIFDGSMIRIGGQISFWIGIIFWIVSLILISISLHHTYNTLKVVEYFSRHIDLATAIGQVVSDRLEYFSSQNFKQIISELTSTNRRDYGDAGPHPAQADTDFRSEVSTENEINRNVARLLSELTTKERDMIALYYGIQKTRRMTVQEIAEKYEAPPNDVEKIIKIALRKCRHPYRASMIRKHLAYIPVIAEQRSGVQQFIYDVFNQGDAVFSP
jgi:ABC-type multidrug transport system fused ATPase/permease subunit